MVSAVTLEGRRLLSMSALPTAAGRKQAARSGRLLSPRVFLLRRLRAAVPSGRMGERLRITGRCSIDASELAWRFDTSGGPGGQHANRSSTRAEVRFDVARSRGLGPRQKERLLERLGPVVIASAGESRSQARNRELALERLRSRLAEGLRVERRRRPTRRSVSADHRRLDAKRRRSALKRERGARPDPEA